MKVITIETASLGDRSYIVHDGSVGLVIVPESQHHLGGSESECTAPAASSGRRQSGDWYIETRAR